jgi:hypothetical protein
MVGFGRAAGRVLRPGGLMAARFAAAWGEAGLVRKVTWPLTVRVWRP